MSTKKPEENSLSMQLLKSRYLNRNEKGDVCETQSEMWERVAENIAKVELNYGSSSQYKETKKKFLKHLKEFDFIPASPILMNAGNKLQYLFSDHALDVGDSMDDIFEMLKIAAAIQQHGGGVGFSFSKIRPKNDSVSGMKNVAFGPLNVINVFDHAFNAIIQAGRRNGANMAILDISHPDIEEFIESKKKGNKLANFNISVAVTDEFINAVKNNENYNLVNPRNEKTSKEVDARELFRKIVEQAWSTGDPGIIFVDEMNRKYPFKRRKILCTGSCGQYELEKFEGVPYVHLNLSKLAKEKDGKKSIDTYKLKKIIPIAVQFLDNCIDANRYFHSAIELRTKKSRKIGLGVMGFADLLFQLEIEYGSDESLAVINKIMTIIRDESRKASQDLAEERGVFPRFSSSTWEKPMRNATITSIAPTGSTSLIAGVSQSIEPVYALSYTSKTSEGNELTILNPYFQEAINKLKISPELKSQLPFMDSIQKIEEIDKKTRNIFKTAMDIKPIEHLRVMAMFQKYVDNSISKTINLPRNATYDDVSEIFLMAYELHCKGITIYRDGCRGDQVLQTSKKQMKLNVFA